MEKFQECENTKNNLKCWDGSYGGYGTNYVSNSSNSNNTNEIIYEKEKIVPTYHSNHIKNDEDSEVENKKFSDSSLKNKKFRVKLICVLPKWRYMVAKTTVQDYHSLFGGVIDQIFNKNHFSSVLNTLEREFLEETTKTIEINFQKRKFIYQKKDFYIGQMLMEELSFTYIGIFYEGDTIFTVIYLPKFTNDIVDFWNRRIREAQENILKKIFEGFKIDLEKIFEVNKVYHQRLMRIKSNYTPISKQVFGFICSKLSHYHHLLEKSGIEIMEEDEFYNHEQVWEWKTMNSENVKNKIKSLFIKTGVQV
jgi:hypothetical protein